MIGRRKAILIRSLTKMFTTSRTAVHTSLHFLRRGNIIAHFRNNTTGVVSNGDRARARRIKFGRQFRLTDTPGGEVTRTTIGVVRRKVAIVLSDKDAAVLVTRKLVATGGVAIVAGDLPTTFTLSRGGSVALIIYNNAIHRGAHSVRNSVTRHSLRSVGTSLVFINTSNVSTIGNVAAFGRNCSVDNTVIATTGGIVTILSSSGFGHHNFGRMLPVRGVSVVVASSTISRISGLTLRGAQMGLVAI